MPFVRSFPFNLGSKILNYEAPLAQLAFHLFTNGTTICQVGHRKQRD